MVRIKQQLTNEEAIELLKKEPRGVLSVLGDDGYPYGVPIDHWYNDADGWIYFHSGKKGHKIDAINRCIKVSFCVYDSGYRKEGEWALNIRSVIVFGRVEIIEDREVIYDISRKLSRKFTDDEGYIAREIKAFAHETRLLKLAPEHISGKHITES
jgi:nitroimidazol reductase NimA-like FMN-containing flavoprotein (pyridoxamine 5'-phosphate oxidase superfamily)